MSQDKEPVILRLLALGPPDESEEFIAGMCVGVIAHLLGEYTAKLRDVSALQNLSIHLGSESAVAKLADFYRMSVEYGPLGESGEITRTCSFQPFTDQIKVVK